MPTQEPPRPAPAKPAQGSSKGLIIAIILGVGFFLMAATAVVGYVAWKYYSRHVASRSADATADTTPEIPPDAPIEATAEPTPEVPPVEATSEPAPEVTPEPVMTEAPAATKAPAKKTRAPKPAATEAPEETREPERRRTVKAQVYDISHVHGGLKKKTCSGTIELSETGIKYDAQTSEDDKEHDLEYTFGQIKKVEMKDAKTVEVSAVDKKWTFRGDGLIVAKITTHLNMHSSEFGRK